MVAESDSLVDNVEHIYLPSLGAGLYDLEVVKRGNSGTNTDWCRFNRDVRQRDFA